MKKETKWTEEITYQGKEWADEIEWCKKLNGRISDKDDELALTICFLWKVEKWEKEWWFL